MSQSPIKFNDIPKDILFLIALDLDLETLSNYCRAQKRFNDIACANETFWITRLKRDFGIEYKHNRKSPKYRYENIYTALNDEFMSIELNLPSYITEKIPIKEIRKDFMKDTIKIVIKPFYDSYIPGTTNWYDLKSELLRAAYIAWSPYWSPNLDGGGIDNEEEFTESILGWSPYTN